MNSEQIIINKMKENGGIITTNEVEKLGIERRILSRLVEKKIIVRENHGLYVLEGELGDEYYSLTYNIPKATFSHLTALYFHGLSDRVPLTYDITISKEYRGRLEHNPKVNLYKVNKEILNLGRIKIKSPQGQEIFVYDIERCLCDLIKDRENIDFEQMKKAFVSYYRIDKNNTFKLYKYASKMGIEKEVNEFMEALLWNLQPV